MKKAIISRTITSNTVKGLYFDMETRTAKDFFTTVPTQYDTGDKVEKYLRKNPDALPGKLIAVESLERCEKLVGMYLDDFIANAKPADERSKETRNSVSKTVITGAGDALYMDKDKKVKTVSVTFPANTTNIDAYVRKTAKFPGYFITVENIHTVEALYYMDEKLFIELARPMKNKFTLD